MLRKLRKCLKSGETIARNFLFMDLGYEDEEEFEDASWHDRSIELIETSWRPIKSFPTN